MKSPSSRRGVSPRLVFLSVLAAGLCVYLLSHLKDFGLPGVEEIVEKAGGNPAYVYRFGPRPALASAEEGEVRVASWNIRWFPAGQMEPQPERYERRNIGLAGNIVRYVRPDILCGMEIRDAETAEALAATQRSEDFKLVVCSEFRQRLFDAERNCVVETNGLQNCAVWSRYPVLESGWDSWHTVGGTDPPRGYAYALLDAPGGPVAVYVVHLKSNFISSDVDDETREKLTRANRLKRELAAEQIRSLVSERMRQGSANPFPPGTRVLVMGDFNLALGDSRWAGETTLQGFLDAGWSMCFDGMPPEKRYTLEASPAEGYPATTFDYIFGFGGTPMRATQVVPPGYSSDHGLVTTLLPKPAAE